MFNRLLVAAFGVGCLTAAAAGGYLATRQNSSDALAAAPAPAAGSAATSAAATPEKPVQETEAVVGDAAKPPAPALAEAPAPEPPRTRRSEVPAPARTARPTPARPTGRQESAPVAAVQPPPSVPPPAPPVEPVARPEERQAPPEPPRAPEPPQRVFEELVISADAVIGLQTENRISSETARVEDRVDARVTRDVKVGDRVAIPAGAKLVGSVTQVDRGGKFKERARLGIRFNTIVLADGSRIPISTETIYRDGDAPGNSTAAKVGGGAVGGAILGAILGGAKGAAIGGTAGAGAGTAAVVAGDRSTAVLTPGTPLTARILSPVTVTIER